MFANPPGGIIGEQPMFPPGIAYLLPPTAKTHHKTSFAFKAGHVL
jgi:phage tail protein X